MMRVRYATHSEGCANFLMSKKTVYKSNREAETGFQRAIQIKLNQGDEGGAQAIADAGIDAWLESTGRQITNPNHRKEQNFMPGSRGPTAAELREENEQLREELESTQSALDEANDRLSQIYDLSSDEFEPD